MPSTFFSEQEQEILQLALRRKVYDVVKRFAGCNFRDLERKSKLATGTLQYHLGYLIKHGIINGQKDGNKTRYFTKEMSTEDKSLLVLLRQKNMRMIILFLLKHKDAQQKDISGFIELSPSTTSDYLSRLVDSQIIGATKKKGKLLYHLMVQESKVIALLVTYQESFFDKLVDQTIEMWAFR